VILIQDLDNNAPARTDEKVGMASEDCLALAQEFSPSHLPSLLSAINIFETSSVCCAHPDFVGHQITSKAGNHPTFDVLSK
jgi:hypothetical protein